MRLVPCDPGTVMNFKSEQVLTKTPQGVNATRSGVGLSPKAYSMLKLFDGTMPVAAFMDACKGAAVSEADFQSTLQELVQLDHLRVVTGTGTAVPPSATAAAERRMLLTLDFTVPGETPAKGPASAGAPAASPVSRAKASPASAPQQPAAKLDLATEDKTARLKRE